MFSSNVKYCHVYELLFSVYLQKLKLLDVHCIQLHVKVNWFYYHEGVIHLSVHSNLILASHAFVLLCSLLQEIPRVPRLCPCRNIMTAHLRVLLNLIHRSFCSKPLHIKSQCRVAHTCILNSLEVFSSKMKFQVQYYKMEPS